MLLVGTGFGIGLGLSEAPSEPHAGVPVPSTRPPSASTSSSTPASTGSGSPIGPTLASLDATVVGGRFVGPVTIGELTVDPAPASTPPAPLGLYQAEAAADAGYSFGLGGTPTVGFGLVSVRGVSTPKGTPTLAQTPAWVGVVLGVNEGAFSCPEEGSSRSATTPFQPEDRAVVLYGDEGRGAVLYDTGGTAPCGGAPVPPSLAVADASVPVPWQQVGPTGLTTTISYQAPECAALDGVGSGGNVNTGVYAVEVTVSFPFARIDCDAVQTFTTSVSVYPPNPGPGAPPSPTRVVLVPSTAPDAVPPALVEPITN
jgi:hypothetical protein